MNSSSKDLVRIIDDFLPDEEFMPMKLTMLSTTFPWFYNDMKVREDETETKYNFQFTHVFYDNLLPNSNMLNIVMPLVEKLSPAALIRIKANLTTVADQVIQMEPHIDNRFPDATTAIFYLNSTDGPTKFIDTGTLVECKENRIVVFPSSTMHSGSTHTDSKYRSVINLNYFQDGPVDV